MNKQQLKTLLADIKPNYEELIVSDILSAFETFNQLNLNVDEYIHHDGSEKKVVSISGKILIDCKNTNACNQIPIEIYVDEDYPLSVPICYVRPTSDMLICVNNSVNSNGLISLAYLNEWDFTKYDLISLLNEISNVLSVNLPFNIKSLKKTASNSRNQKHKINQNDIVKILESSKICMNSYAHKDIMDALEIYYSLTPSVEEYIYTNGNSNKLFTLHGTIPVKHNSTTFDIPIQIYLEPNHPFMAPMCYIRLKPDMKFEMNRYVKLDCSINVPYLKNWSSTRHNLVTLLIEISFEFTKTPPLHPKMKELNSDANIQRKYDNIPVITRKPQYENVNSLTSLDSLEIASPNIIKLSLMSAIVDKVRLKFNQYEDQFLKDIDALKQISLRLETGEKQLNCIILNGKIEIEGVQKFKEEIIEKSNRLKENLSLIKHRQINTNIENAIVLPAPIYRQLVQLFAEELAIQDFLYYLNQGLLHKTVNLESFLAQTRFLSRKMFFIRSLILKCREHAGLPR